MEYEDFSCLYLNYPFNFIILSAHNPSTNQLVAHDDLLPHIRRWGAELGFSHIGVSGINLTHAEAGLLEWLAKGFHGQMHYMQRHGLKRARPAELVPGTVTVITARMNYLAPGTSTDEGRWTHEEQALLKRADEGLISTYARGRDYHKVLRKRLETLAQKIQQHVGNLGYRVFTDSAPVLEAELAVQSGQGWRGKHTLVLSRSAGSMFFLGEIYLDFFLQPTPKEDAHCGSCQACMDVCPTKAIVAPYLLDARRCISYLTIEHNGSIPLELRPLMGNHIYGCDDCQTICPWNKYATASTVVDFESRSQIMDTFESKDSFSQGSPTGGVRGKKLTEYFAWTKEEFDHKTQGSVIARIGYERWLRNIAVAMGNALASNDPNAEEFKTPIKAALTARLDHPSAMVVEHSAWALSQFTG